MRLTGIAILLFRFSNAVVIHVDTCPNDEESWLERSRKFKCKDSNEVYHCIKTSDGHLIETCMKSYVIKSYKVGCPYVHIQNGISYLRSPFLACDLMHHKCPERFHDEYSTNELYLYPACIDHGSSTTSKKTYSVTETPRTISVNREAHKPDSHTLPITIGMFILGMCLGLFIKMVYERLRRAVPATSPNKQISISDIKIEKDFKEFNTDKEEPCQSNHSHRVEPRESATMKKTEEPYTSGHNHQLEPLISKDDSKGHDSSIMRRRKRYEQERLTL